MNKQNFKYFIKGFTISLVMFHNSEIQDLVTTSFYLYDPLVLTLTQVINEWSIKASRK